MIDMPVKNDVLREEYQLFQRAGWIATGRALTIMSLYALYRNWLRVF